VAIAKRDNLWIAARFLGEDQDPGSALATDLYSTGAAGEAGQPFLYLLVHLRRLEKKGTSPREPMRSVVEAREVPLEILLRLGVGIGTPTQHVHGIHEITG
jgi:hypothetical protein